MNVTIIYKLFLFLLLLGNLIFPQSLNTNSPWNSNSQIMDYKAISYNIHRGQTQYGLPSLDQINKILKSENPDFIALQEVDRYHLRSGLKDQIKWLSEQLDMEYIFASNLHFGITEYGNAILSKYPILEYGQIKLAYETEPRSLLWAKVETEDGILYITSIHLGFDKEKRAEHFAIIEEFAATISHPILLMGDFNVLPTHQAFSHFRLNISGKLLNKEIPTYMNHSPVQIDYILGKGIEELDMYNIPSKASDHYPLVLIFKFNKNNNSIAATTI